MLLLGGLIEGMARRGFATLDELRGLLAVSLDPREAKTERAKYVISLRAADRGERSR
jgi:dihydroorotate dehydrogenase (fumarate)